MIKSVVAIFGRFSKYKWLILFFVLFYAVGVLLALNSPGSFDERNNRKLGIQSFNQIGKFFEQDGIKNPVWGMEHGTAHEMLYQGIERIVDFNPETERGKIYKLRHVMVFTVFFCAAIAFYLICLEWFKKRALGVLGILLFLFHPRIFNHSFHNSSDISFLSFCTIAVYFIFKANTSKQKLWLLPAALFSALAMDTRLPGIMLVGFGFYALFFTWRIEKHNITEFFSRCVIFAVASVIFTVMLWPFLWGDPWGNFLFALDGMSRLAFKLPELYWGTMMSSHQLPWHYNFSWIAITTPPAILFVWGLGHVYIAIELFKNPAELAKNWRLHVVLGWAWVPLLLPVILGSTLFNSWRHHFFVYPALVLIGLYGVNYFLHQLPERFRNLKAINLIAAGMLLWPIVHLHPYHNLYLNFIPSLKILESKSRPEVPHVFSLDYWGLTYKSGLIHIAKINQARVKVQSLPPIRINWELLDDEYKNKIELVKKKTNTCDYFMGNLRRETDSMLDQEYGAEVYSKYYGTHKVLSVRKCNRSPDS